MVFCWTDILGHNDSFFHKRGTAHLGLGNDHLPDEPCHNSSNLVMCFVLFDCEKELFVVGMPLVVPKG